MRIHIKHLTEAVETTMLVSHIDCKLFANKSRLNKSQHLVLILNRPLGVNM